VILLELALVEVVVAVVTDELDFTLARAVGLTWTVDGDTVLLSLLRLAADVVPVLLLQLLQLPRTGDSAAVSVALAVLLRAADEAVDSTTAALMLAAEPSTSARAAEVVGVVDTVGILAVGVFAAATVVPGVSLSEDAAEAVLLL
jgi:hypothetical protein